MHSVSPSACSQETCNPPPESETRLRAVPTQRTTYAYAVVQFAPLVEKLTRSCRARSDYDDIRQEAVLGLFRAVDTWRDDGGMTFVSWAAKWITAYVLRELHRARRRGLCGDRERAAENTTSSFDAPTDSGDDDGATLHDRVGVDATVESELGEVQARAWLLHFAGAMSPRHALILERYMNGETYEQIAATLGLSRERVRQLVAIVVERAQQCTGATAPAEELRGAELERVARDAGMTAATLRRRLRMGIPLATALAMPLDPRGRKRAA